jgi:hypothetical protein
MQVTELMSVGADVSMVVFNSVFANSVYYQKMCIVSLCPLASSTGAVQVLADVTRKAECRADKLLVAMGLKRVRLAHRMLIMSGFMPDVSACAVLD